MSKPSMKMKIEVRSLEGDVLGTLEFEGPKDLEVTIYKKIERSPLHPEAINMDDLKVGMNVRRHNARYGTSTRDVGLITGEPFRRGTKYHELGNALGDAWMVPVVTTNYAGKLVHEDWFLADMGIVPYEHSDGGSHWNDQNYTLAVN